MIRFISNHQELSFRGVRVVDQGVDLIRLKLDTHLDPETVFQIQKDGFRADTMVKSEGIYDIDHSIVFQKGNQPAIFIDQNGNYGFRVNGELVKHGQIDITKINASKLDELSEKVERLKTQTELK